MQASEQQSWRCQGIIICVTAAAAAAVAQASEQASKLVMPRQQLSW
jgi:hypothetical protein